MTRRRWLLLAAAPFMLGCTPEQLQGWIVWYQADPNAATEFANQEWVQENLRLDWDQDGVVEPEAAPEPEQQSEPERASVPASSRVGVWDRIAQCESGGNWSHPPVTNGSGTYSGGLMIGHRWWGPNGGNQYASAPYLASKAEQIAVAETIAADIGLDRGWQCYP